MKHIKIIGDSLSAGAGSSLSYKSDEVIFEDNGAAYHKLISPNGWGSLLERYLKQKDKTYTVSNKGCCGAYSYQIDRFLDLLVSEEDQCIFLLMGANDRKRINGMDELRRNSTSVITRLKDMGKEVILLTPNPSTYQNEHRENRIYHTDEVVEILRDTARRNHILLIDNYKLILDYLEETGFAIEDIMKEEGCKSDGLHPPDRVQRMIFEHIVKELRL